MNVGNCYSFFKMCACIHKDMKQSTFLENLYVYELKTRIYMYIYKIKINLRKIAVHNESA